MSMLMLMSMVMTKAESGQIAALPAAPTPHTIASGLGDEHQHEKIVSRFGLKIVLHNKTHWQAVEQSPVQRRDCASGPACCGLKFKSVGRWL
eukprot:2322930-Rhodomonas_salina.1